MAIIQVGIPDHLRGAVYKGFATEHIVEQLSPLYADISSRNLKHLQKHLAEFRNLDPSLALTDVLTLGQRIASRPENLLGIPGGRQVFEDVVMIGGQQVRVRVVLNPSGALRSVHLRL